MEGYNNNSLVLPDNTPYQYEYSETDLFGQTYEMDSGEIIANLNEAKDIKLDLKELESEPLLQAIDIDNGFDIYPTLPPWGRLRKFSYDKWGQLSEHVKFEKADLQEYLYEHPLRDSLIIWIQRHPSQAHLLYHTQYGASCRYEHCAPRKGNPNAITIGHYRIAIDELTGRLPKHKADTYMHAAFFHVSCFEDMLDLAQVTRDFDVRCENRPVVNAPNREKTRPKNRMLLEERRIPHAVTQWLERAREDPTWMTRRVEDGMNYLVYTQKFGLRPHRKKCTEVPGMEKVGRDISYMGNARAVVPGGKWGGRRVKGLTVAELAALEGRPYDGPAAGNKRQRSVFEEYEGEEEGEVAHVSPPTTRARLSSPVGNVSDPIVLGSSKSPSPVRFQKPGKLRNDPQRTRSRRQRQVMALAERPIQFAEAPMPTVAYGQPVPRSELRRKSQLPENILNASALPPGAIIRTAGGDYLRNPVTGMLEPILGITTLDSYQGPPTPDPTGTQYPQTPMQYNAPTVRMGFSVATPAQPISYSTPAPTTPMAWDMPIDPVLLEPENNSSTALVKREGEVDNWDLFGDSPPPPPRTAIAEVEFDISQYEMCDVEPYGMQCPYSLVETAPVPMEFDESLFNIDTSFAREPQQAPTQDTMAFDESLFGIFDF